MVNFSAFFTLIMGITTLFTDNLPGARIFTSLSQKLLAAPTEAHYQETLTVITHSYITATFTTTAKLFTTATPVFTTTTPAFTSTMASPSNELAIFTGSPVTTTSSILSLAKEFVCAMFNNLSAFTAFLFWILLLVTALACSLLAMKSEDLVGLEAQINKKDEAIEKLRSWYAAEHAELLSSLQFERDEASMLLATTSAKHTSAMATKDREIFELRQKLAGADLREDQARFESSDKVVKLHQEIGLLRSVVDILAKTLEAREELVAGAEEAQEKTKVAEERALAAAQEAHESKQKVEAAKKANEVIEKLKDQVRIEEYKVQDLRKDVKGLKKEMEELKARAEGAAQVPTLPNFVARPSATVAQEMRVRIQAAVPVASGTPSVPVPGSSSGPGPATAPEPLAPGEQQQPRRLVRRAPRGPFAPIVRRQGAKK